MNKITHMVLNCCYKHICSNDDIRALLKINQDQFNNAVAKLLLLKYITRSIEQITITPAGRVYIEAMKGFK